MSKPEVTIFTDGSCLKNPGGPGGWAAILKTNWNGAERHKEIFGHDPDTTNNRMEMAAALNALLHLKKPCKVTLYTDSQYLQNGMKSWVKGWMAKNWQTTTGLVKNRDLWEALVEAAKPHDITWEWVKGHRGHPENERCDELAGLAAGKEPKKPKRFRPAA